jgi:hypothetical protein
VNYSCRDDYGAGIAQVSAWAGLHYFASRDDAEFLTWPAGNGWLVQELMKRLTHVDFQKAVVFRMDNAAGAVQVDAFILETGECVRWAAKAAVCAMPRFVAQRIIGGMEPMPSLQYSPWAVANLTWHGPMTSTWDSVFYEGRSLGYVSATHQTLRLSQPDTVLTWYQPLDHLAPPQARQEALNKPWAVWRDEILAEMKRGHSDATQHISQIDVMLWGQGMIRPVPGFVWSAAREQMSAPRGRIAFAHTDMSGISLFEEACARGAAAASQVRHWLDHA